MTDNNTELMPLVSVVLPVFNEESFISDTLECIITQNYENLEIIISDNHSSDGTASICRQFARRDRRIQLFEQSSNIGATANHCFLTRKAKGEYIIFTAGHDKWSDNYISSNVAELVCRPSAVVSYGTPYWIDEDDIPLERFSGWFDSRGLTVISRFFIVFWGKANPILGLIRRNKLPDLENYNFVGADNVILCRLALQGEFIHTVDTLFYRRQNRKPENHNQRLKRYVSDEMKISSSFLTSFFPLIRLPIELCKTVAFAQLSLVKKIMILLILLPAIPIKYFSEISINR